MRDISLERKRAAHAEALDNSLTKCVDHLSSMPDVKKIILFGSYASGRRDLFTDLDLMVVMVSNKDFVKRTAELYRQLPIKVDMDLLVYTPGEFEKMSKRGFIRHALLSGRVIYEK